MFCFFLKTDDNHSYTAVSATSLKEYDWELDDIGSLLTDVCEILQETTRTVFWVEGFGQSPWPVDVVTDLVVFLEQLPGLVQWIVNGTDVFDLDFYEQGIDRTLKFNYVGKEITITCESWGKFEPSPQIENISRQVLTEMISEFVKHFFNAANKVAPGIVVHEWFVRWFRAVHV